MQIKNKFWLKNTLVLTAVALLSACPAYREYTNPQKGHPAMSDVNQSLQEAYTANKRIAHKRTNLSPLNTDLATDLMSGGSMPGRTAKEPRFDVAANDVPAKDFFMGLVKDTPHNIIVSPKIEGTITLNLKQVTINEVLQATKSNYGYQFKQTSYGYEVYPYGLETRNFTINYLDIDRTGKSNTSVSSGQISQKITGGSGSGSNNAATGALPSTTGSGNATKDVTPTSSIETKSKNDFWKQLLEATQAIVGTKDGREVVVNPAAGLVFVRAYPDELEAVGKYLDSIQATMTRQVIIEAKVIEITLNDGFQAGVNWNALGIAQNGLRAFSTDLPAFSDDPAAPNGSIFTIKGQFHGDSFKELINLLSTQGNVQTLSSPRIATLNNQKAIIKVGTDQFFITNVVNTTVTGTSTQNSQNVELTPFFSGISLDVTPEIDQDNKVILHIHPMISNVTQKDLTYTLNNGGNSTNNTNTLPLALSTIRESDNIVSAENGQVVVIGGLMGRLTQENTASTPFLSKAPVIGALFRRNNQVSQKTELVILLRPIVVGNNTWTKEIRGSISRVNAVKRGFHYGTAPEIFGNQAEQNIKTR